MYVRNGATIEEIRAQERSWRRVQRAVMFDLIGMRMILTGVIFIATLANTKRLCPALKDARHAWRLEVFR